MEFSSKDGYFFELRQDINGSYGLREDFTCTVKDNSLVVSLTSAIDPLGNLLKPAYNDKADGFVPLHRYLCKENGITAESISNFCKSHKGSFSVLNKSFYLVVDGSFIYDLTTGELKDNKLSLYMPSAFVEKSGKFPTKKGGQQPALLAFKISTEKGLHKIELNKLVIRDLYKHIFLELTKDMCTSREIYVQRRLTYEPLTTIPQDNPIHDLRIDI